LVSVRVVRCRVAPVADRKQSHATMADTIRVSVLPTIKDFSIVSEPAGDNLSRRWWRAALNSGLDRSTQD